MVKSSKMSTQNQIVIQSSSIGSVWRLQPKRPVTSSESHFWWSTTYSKYTQSSVILTSSQRPCGRMSNNSLYTTQKDILLLVYGFNWVTTATDHYCVRANSQNRKAFNCKKSKQNKSEMIFKAFGVTFLPIFFAHAAKWQETVITKERDFLQTKNQVKATTALHRNCKTILLHG